AGIASAATGHDADAAAPVAVTEETATPVDNARDAATPVAVPEGTATPVEVRDEAERVSVPVPVTEQSATERANAVG
ncbi:hypothetical protein NGM37_31140, partial [Streptomyces sp. TRM76130]|nr:hypothetical protein [Streptomyces sp. TRM76130]